MLNVKRFCGLLLVILSTTSLNANSIDSNLLPRPAIGDSGLTMSNQLLSVDNLGQIAPVRKIEQRTDPKPVERKPPIKNEFQSFVEQSTEKPIEMYGYDIFRNPNNALSPIENIPVTSDYAIGPGDELMISLWGQVEANETVIVDRNGSISLPKIGIINVAGIQYQNLQSHLKTAISKLYKNFELNVSLGKLRSIQVYVVGQADQPGNYTVSSMSTLVNVIFAAGGPSNKGSMRHIQLKRNGKLVTEFDMYDLILKGDKSKDVKLLPGDVVYFPAIGHMAAIVGSVNSAAIYELKGKETLADLIDLSGGLSNIAAGQKVIVERILNHEKRLVDEFMLSQSGLGTYIQDGDLVTVNSISPGFDNAITIKGNVATPARRPWRQGIRVSDIIPNKGMLITDKYWEKQNRFGLKKTEDKERIGEIKAGSSEINWDYAVVQRLNPETLSTSLHPFNLGKAINSPEDENNLVLEPGDVITIFSKNDIQVPISKRTKYVTVEGEFKNPGVYQIAPGETIRQLINRVGGITPDAYLLATEYTRESTRNDQQKRLDEIIQKMEESVQRNALQNPSKDASELANTKAQLEAQNHLVAKMREVKATGRVVLDVTEDNPKVKDLPEIALEDGDRIYIPSVPNTVNVFGQVYNQNAFLFNRGQTVADYLSKAGGPTRDADKDEIYLVRTDGVVLSKRQSSYLFGTVSTSFNSHAINPGDTLVVPEKLDKYNLTKDLKDWSQIFYQFAIGIASMKTIGLF